jgi:hypothetical protein
MVWMTASKPDPAMIDWPPAGIAVPTVQLRHLLTDGSRHVDWLIGRDPDGRAPLISFRVEGPLGEIGPGEEAALEQRSDHRPMYLEFEGEIAGGRGRAERIAKGIAMVHSRENGRIEIEVWWEPCDAAAPVRGECFSIEIEGMGEESRNRRWKLRRIATTMAELPGTDSPPS